MKYVYKVGPNQTFLTPQDAIDAVANDLPAAALAKNVKIILDDAGYPAFTLPDNLGFKFLQDQKRLEIKSAGNYSPVIDANKSSGVFGIDIGTNNPNVTVCGLQIRGFNTGIRALLNSRNLIVRNCLLQLNRYAGIACYNTTNCALTQNIVTDGNYGLLVDQCHNAAVYFNTVRLDGTFIHDADLPVIGMYIRAHDDTGIGRGTIYVSGNISAIKYNKDRETQYCLGYFEEDLQNSAIQANKNCYFLGKTKEIGIYTDKYAFGVNLKKSLSLNEFKPYYWQEMHSIGDDPKYVWEGNFGKGKNFNTITFGPKATSPCIAKIRRIDKPSTLNVSWLGVADAITRAQWEESVTKDFNRVFRAETTTIGALEKTSLIDLFNAKIEQPPDYFDPSKLPWCDDDFVNDIFDTDVNIVRPTLEPGYFYVGDRPFYLYRDKRTKNLSDLLTVVVDLPGGALTGDVYYNGEKLVSNISHDKVLAEVPKDLYGYRGGEVTFKGTTTSWTGDICTTGSLTMKEALSDCEQHYFLPEEFVADGPVSITDDLTTPYDNTGMLNQEFLLEFNEDFQRYEIVFPASNKFMNPKFCATTGVPLFWEASGASTVEYIGLSGQYFPIIGEYSVELNTSGWIGQTVPIGTSGVFSFYSKTSGDNKSGYVSFDYFDSEGRKIWETNSGAFTGTDEWTRHSYPLADYPDIIEYVKPKVSAYESGLVVDAFQYEDDRLRNFNFKPLDNFATVEFESKSEGSYVDRSITLSPHLNYGKGFLSIPELSARQYDYRASVFSTTLFDWKWAAGRKEIIPWSRLYGKDKLHCTPVESTDRPHYVDTIRLIDYIAQPETITINPDPTIVTQGDEVGAPILIHCQDIHNNNYGFGHCNVRISTSNGNYPGLLGSKFHGMKDQLGTVFSKPLTSYGTLNVQWVPPTAEDISYRGPIPTTISSRSSDISYLDLDYSINAVNAGNPIILKLGTSTANAGHRYTIYGTETIETVKTSPYNRNRFARVQYPIKYDAVKVYVGDKKLRRIYSTDLAEDTYFYDLDNEQILVNSSVKEIRVKYTPRYVFVNPNEPNVMAFFHDKIFGNDTGNISIFYDATIFLQVDVYDRVLENFKSAVTALVAKSNVQEDTKVLIG